MGTELTNIIERRTELQARAAEDVLDDYKHYREEVLTDGDADDMRKLVELQMKLIGAEADKKGDANAHLPVFQFVFHGGAVEATIQASPVTLEAPDTRGPWPFPNRPPDPQLAGDAAPPVDEVVPKPLVAPTAETLLADLDGLLRAADDPEDG